MTAEYLFPVILLSIGSVAIFVCIMMWRIERDEKRRKYGDHRYYSRTRRDNDGNTQLESDLPNESPPERTK